MDEKKKEVSFGKTTEVPRSDKSSSMEYDDEDSTDEEHHEAKISPTTKANGSNSFRSKVLRSNLTRTHKNRDPLFYYEVQQVLGVGSMGSVVKVRKRDSVVGGSARKDLKGVFQRERMVRDCVNVPIFGWLIRNCLPNPLVDHKQASTHTSNSLRSLLNLGGSINTGTPFTPVNESIHSSDTISSFGAESKLKQPYDMTYAMKSIHLSRVMDPTFVEELRNEILVLKALDHPHIGQCTFSYHLHNLHPQSSGWCLFCSFIAFSL